MRALLFGQTLGAGRIRGRSALGRRFDRGEGRGQHAFGVARPLVQLCLGLVTPPWRELFHIPNFHIPTGLVVAQEALDVESSSRLDFLLLHNLRRRFIA